jgi:HD-like signal output (HDOD) protein
MDQKQFSQLIDLFQRAEALPPLPETALRLIEVIDGGDPSVHQVDDIVSADPALAANVIRAASRAAYAAYGTNVTTITGAVIRLGVRNVRTLALTFALHTVFGRTTRSHCFDQGQFARHSVFVGAMSEFLYVRAACETTASGPWSPQEMFSAGLLHDLPKCLLASVAPEIYDAVWERAQAEASTYETAFKACFGEELALLGCAAVVAWRLPELFARSMAFVAEPPDDPQHALARDCLVYADSLAPEVGYAIEEWSVAKPDVAVLVPPFEFAIAEMPGTLKLISDHCELFGASA